MSHQNHRFRSITTKILALLCACAFLLAPATPTQALPPAQTTPAFPNAFFHTQSLGNQGTDVKAIQYLLSIYPSGVFDSATDSAVRNFQQAWGLYPVDGIVGPATWNRLSVTLRQGNSGNPVRAVQILLKEKRTPSLLVNGIFDAATDRAVRDFEAHAGLTQDGIMDLETWKNLVWHYERIDFSQPSMCAVPTYYYQDYAKWGTAAAVGQLEAAAQVRYQASNGRDRVAIEELSLEHGGDILNHTSHEVGLDVDIRPIATDRRHCEPGIVTNWDGGYYDRAATRELVKAIHAQAYPHVALIIFDDPVLKDEGLTIIDPKYPHREHLHVRYCEKVHPDPEGKYTCVR